MPGSTRSSPTTRSTTSFRSRWSSTFPTRWSARRTCPTRTPRRMIEAARKNPGALKLANAGIGTGQHIVGAAFMSLTGTKFLEVPYRGSAAAFPDLLSGRVDLFFDSTPAALPYVKSGQAKGIGYPDRETKSADSRCADHDGIGRAQSRNRFLDRIVRARQDAARRDRAPAASDRAVAARTQAALRRQRRRTHGASRRSAQSPS